MEQMLSVKQVSELLNISKPTVVRLIKAGRLKAINVGTAKMKLYRVFRKSLEDFYGSNRS